MVEVFRTNINDNEAANSLITELQAIFPLSAITFDLEDCDRVLRLKGDGLNTDRITHVLGQRGFVCETLD